MVSHALALVLAAAPTDGTLAVKVVSLAFSYPYFGEPGNTCKRGNVYLHALADPQSASPKKVVVRLVDSAGLTPGSEAVLGEVRRAGTGRDGTEVYCSTGRQAATPPPAPPAVAAVDAGVPPPLVQAQPAAVEPAKPPPAPPAEAAAQPAGGKSCTSRLFNIIKKPLGENKFGPSEFDPESALGAAEAVDCGVARSKVTNVLLIKMVKDVIAKPETVAGAEWGPGSTWQREPDAPQRRAVKVYFIESP